MDSGRFPTTGWATIIRARSSQENDAGRSCPGDDALHALGEIVERYRRPLLIWAKSQFPKYTEHLEDWFQDFTLKQIISKDFLSSADPTRGRFRNYLLKSFRNSILNRIEFEQRHVRNPENGFTLMDEEPEASFSEESAQFVAEFELTWAKEILEEVIAQTVLSFNDEEPELVELFKGRFLNPFLKGTAPISYKELSTRFPEKTATQLGSQFNTVKSRFRKIRYQIYQQYGYSSEEFALVDHELISIFGTNPFE